MSNNYLRYPVHVVEKLDLNIGTSDITSQLDIKRWPHLRDMPIHEPDILEVKLLTGHNASDLPETVKKKGKWESVLQH